MYQGLQRRLYSYSSLPNGQPEPVAARCIAMHSAAVEKAYQLQPTSVEAVEAHFQQYRDALMACIHENGEPIDADMTEDEIMRSVGKVMDTASVDCLARTGYDG
jgi:hypothetical protein